MGCERLRDATEGLLMSGAATSSLTLTAPCRRVTDRLAPVVTVVTSTSPLVTDGKSWGSAAKR